MISDEQIEFQTPNDVDRNWGETLWLGFYVPEENIYGWVYMVFRAGVGTVKCDVEFIDRRSHDMFDARYIDIQDNIPMPDSLRAFELPNGVSFSSASPTEYRLDYVGAHDTEIHLDLTAVHEPYDIHDPDLDPMARAARDEAIEHSGFGTAYAGHFDITTRDVGTIRIRGEEYEVDCLATQDHSWGPRAERGMRTMGYVNAHFDDDYVVQSIWDFDPSKPNGKQHIFKHGYVVRDGQLFGGIDGSMEIEHRGMYPARLHLSVTAEDGSVHSMVGSPLAYNNWVPYGCAPTGHAMVDWTTDSGEKGVGTSMHAFTLDTVTGDFLHKDIRETSSAYVDA